MTGWVKKSAKKFQSAVSWSRAAKTEKPEREWTSHNGSGANAPKSLYTSAVPRLSIPGSGYTRMARWTLRDYLYLEGYNDCEQFELITGLRRYGCRHREPHIFEWCERWFSSQLAVDGVDRQADRGRIQDLVVRGARGLPNPMTAPAYPEIVQSSDILTRGCSANSGRTSASSTR